MPVPDSATPPESVSSASPTRAAGSAPREQGQADCGDHPQLRRALPVVAALCGAARQGREPAGAVNGKALLSPAPPGASLGGQSTAKRTGITNLCILLVGTGMRVCGSSVPIQGTRLTSTGMLRVLPKMPVERTGTVPPTPKSAETLWHYRGADKRTHRRTRLYRRTSQALGAHCRLHLVREGVGRR